MSITLEQIFGHDRMGHLSCYIMRHIYVMKMRLIANDFISRDLEGLSEMQLSAQFPPKADPPMAGASACLPMAGASFGTMRS